MYTTSMLVQRLIVVPYNGPLKDYNCNTNFRDS